MERSSVRLLLQLCTRRLICASHRALISAVICSVRVLFCHSLTLAVSLARRCLSYSSGAVVGGALAIATAFALWCCCRQRRLASAKRHEVQAAGGGGETLEAQQQAAGANRQQQAGARPQLAAAEPPSKKKRRGFLLLEYAAALLGARRGAA